MTRAGPISLEGCAAFWVAAGGPPTLASLMAYVARAESGCNPGAIQQTQPYATTGWGLWQITPGDSETAIGIDYELCTPLLNAHAAVAKYHAQGIEAWEGDPVAGPYMQTGVQPTPLVVPAPASGLVVLLGEYEPTGPAPAGTHNTYNPTTPVPVTQRSTAMIGYLSYEGAQYALYWNPTTRRVERTELNGAEVKALAALGAKVVTLAATVVAKIPVTTAEASTPD